MEKIIFECETITPMFIYGADGKTPELRPASIKGLMRFWWRAIHGDLPLDKLKKREDEIFGSMDKKSSFSIRMKNLNLQKEFVNPLPHKTSSFKKNSFQSNQTFQIEFFGKNLDEIKNIFTISMLLGGFGQRSRRGFGSIQIIGDEALGSLEDIKRFVDEIPKFQDKQKREPYPYIKDRKIGKKYEELDQLLKTISDATHNHNDDTLGFAKGSNRLASPIYVSVLKLSTNDYRPIITTLNNPKSTNTSKVEDFKRAIL